MSRFTPDSNVIIATVCGWHDRHDWSRTAMEERLARGAELVVTGHSLLESYAVLTRLPPPHRIAPDVARDLIEGGFARVGRVAVLHARGYGDLLKRAPTLTVSGGRIYDALIARTAAEAGVHELLTLNPAHFDGLLDERIEVIAP